MGSAPVSEFGPWAYLQTFRKTITGTVLAMIIRSSPTERLPMYSRSSSTFLCTSSMLVSYPRFSCARPVIPGKTLCRS